MRYVVGELIGRRQVILVIILLLSVAVLATGCQGNGSWNKLTQGGVPAAQAAAGSSDTPPTATPKVALTAPPMPTATPSQRDSTPPKPPKPLGTPAKPNGEMDAATKVIPIQTATLPKGPRKPPPNHLLIPSIGVDVKVIELGTHYNEEGELVWDTAPFSAGHHVGTANPGEPGNVVISGHISSIHEGAVFKRLPEIKVGAGVVVGATDREYLYQVIDKKVVDPTQIEVMNSTTEQILTIITCVPDGVYSHRLVVTAKRI